MESDVLDGESGEEPLWVGLRFGNDVVAVMRVELIEVWDLVVE